MSGRDQSIINALDNWDARVKSDALRSGRQSDLTNDNPSHEFPDDCKFNINSILFI
jgi:hypothetical protein